MKVLVACEFSGTVRDAFLALGHDAISCDLLPTESPGPHIEGDVLEELQKPWDLVIAHPPCTYLANSGVSWLDRQPGRREKMLAAADFFRACLNANAPRVAVENPVMHGEGQRAVGRNWDFSVHPWQFGHPYSKQTCFWVRMVPPLWPTKIVASKGTHAHQPHIDKGSGDERRKRRSVTFPGIAQAMAEQWGSLNP